MKFQIVFFASLFFISILQAQEHRVIAVDGYFTNKDSSYVVNYLGSEFIKEVVNIPSDSAQVLIGEIGKMGITNIITINPRDNKSQELRTKENLLFEIKPTYFVNDKEVDKTVVSKLHPSTFISVSILSQLMSAQKYGKEKRYGAVSIKQRLE
jgi:hypothetical protein